MLSTGDRPTVPTGFLRRATRAIAARWGMSGAQVSDDLRVILADDHPMVRASLVDLIDGTEGMRVVAVADDGEQAVRAATSTEHDLVLLDLMMPVMDGGTAARLLKSQRPDIPVLILTASSEKQPASAPVPTGADVVLDKDGQPAALVAAIREAAADH